MKEGWSKRRISDICLTTDYVANGSFAALRENVQYLDGDGYAILMRLTDSTRGWNGQYKYVSKEAYEFLRKSSLVPGDLIMSNVGEPGKVFIIPDLGKPMTLGPNSILIRCNGLESTNSFLYYYFSSAHGRSQIDNISEGVAQKKFNKTAFRNLSIPLPPLPEQQRIVGILDEAFDGIATAKANAEKNLQNARALFESHLQSVFTQHGEGWVENKLKSITTKIGSGATPRGGEESYKLDGISLIRSLNVHDMGFRYTKLAFLDDTQANELSNVEVQRKDVLLNITGASVTRCCIVPEDVLPARVNQHVSIIRPIADKLDADFLHYLLISRPYKDQLLQTGAEGGSTRQAITKAQIQEFAVEYPATLKEQKTIVAKLDAMLAETQRLKSIYQQKLIALEALKKSLLHQAFSGHL